ncbi:hypothetical protein LPJ56_002494, partial [Coemansia sp. RSA 2599]
HQDGSSSQGGGNGPGHCLSRGRRRQACMAERYRGQVWDTVAGRRAPGRRVRAAAVADRRHSAPIQQPAAGHVRPKGPAGARRRKPNGWLYAVRHVRRTGSTRRRRVDRAHRRAARAHGRVLRHRDRLPRRRHRDPRPVQSRRAPQDKPHVCAQDPVQHGRGQHQHSLRILWPQPRRLHGMHHRRACHRRRHALYQVWRRRRDACRRKRERAAAAGPGRVFKDKGPGSWLQRPTPAGLAAVRQGPRWLCHRRGCRGAGPRGAGARQGPRRTHLRRGPRIRALGRRLPYNGAAGQRRGCPARHAQRHSLGADQHHRDIIRQRACDVDSSGRPDREQRDQIRVYARRLPFAGWPPRRLVYQKRDRASAWGRWRCRGHIYRFGSQERRGAAHAEPGHHRRRIRIRSELCASYIPAAHHQRCTDKLLWLWRNKRVADICKIL